MTAELPVISTNYFHVKHLSTLVTAELLWGSTMSVVLPASFPTFLSGDTFHFFCLWSVSCIYYVQNSYRLPCHHSFNFCPKHRLQATAKWTNESFFNSTAWNSVHSKASCLFIVVSPFKAFCICFPLTGCRKQVYLLDHTASASAFS